MVKPVTIGKAKYVKIEDYHELREKTHRLEWTLKKIKNKAINEKECEIVELCIEALNNWRGE